jgi:hypothetical protein
VVGELTPDEALEQGLITADEAQRMNGARASAGIGHNGAPPEPADPGPDPLAGMTHKQIFVDCIWISDESSTTKLFLLCISKYFDKNRRGSSMSYAQVSADCSFSERTSIRAAKESRDRWLKIGVQKGFKTASGQQNIYHGIPPEKWVTELRRRKSNGLTVVFREHPKKGVEF